MNFSYKKWYWALWWRAALIGFGAFSLGATLVVLLVVLHGDKALSGVEASGLFLDIVAIGFGVLGSYATTIFYGIRFVKKQFPDYVQIFQTKILIFCLIGGVAELFFVVSPLSLFDSFIPPALALLALRLTLSTHVSTARKVTEKLRGQKNKV